MKQKILLIEDDKQLANNLICLLEEEEYIVLHANDGEIGIKMAISEKPNLIISDIMIPGINGFKVKKILNTRNDTFDIPLLFLTAKTDIRHLRYGMLLGADDYLFKPYKALDLLETVKMRIKKKNREIAKFIAQNKDGKENLKKLNNNDTILIKIGSKSRLISLSKIKIIKANSQYSDIILTQKDILLVRKSLTTWEKNLPSNFVRIHRSVIINIEYIKKMAKNKNKSHTIYMEGNTNPLIMSRRYSSKLKSLS